MHIYISKTGEKCEYDKMVALGHIYILLELGQQERIFYSVLHMLVIICGCQLNSSSIIHQDVGTHGLAKFDNL